MSHELFYTSAPRGLRPGSRGFCTVAVTHGLPVALLEKLEALSGYRPLFPPHDANAALNPVVHAHLRINAGGKTYSVLSRICAAGLDYTERSNKFAHHVVLEPGEWPAAGPAWLLGQPGFMEQAWDGQVRHLPAGRTPPLGDAFPAICRAWEALTGDAGWAGVVAESFRHDPNRLVYLLFEPGMDLLPLLVEALALLPAEQRWEVTFSTYFTGLPQGTVCLWRGVPRDSAEARAARKFPNALILDVGTDLGTAHGGTLVALARGQAATAAEGAPGNGYPGEPFLLESGGRTSRPPLQPAATAVAVNLRPVAELLPPPLPSAGRTEKGGGRGWFLGSTIGLAVGVLLSVGVGWVALRTGVLPLGETAPSSAVSSNDRTEPAPPAKPSALAPADGGQLKDHVPIPGFGARTVNFVPLKKAPNRNDGEINHWKQQAKDEKKRREEKENELAKLRTALEKEQANSRDLRTTLAEQAKRDPSIADQLRSLLQGGKSVSEEDKKKTLAQLDDQIYGLVAESDRTHSTFTPGMVSNYHQLPKGSREENIPLPKSWTAAPKPENWALRLVGLKKPLQQKNPKPDKLIIFRVTGQGRDTSEKHIARFERKDNYLVFRWEAIEDTDRDVDDRRAVRNAVLEMSKNGSTPLFMGLMRYTGDPTWKFPLVFDFTKGKIQASVFRRNKEERVENDLFLASAGCELGGQMRVLRGGPDTATLEWNAGNNKISLRLSKIDATPGEYKLEAQWYGEATDAPRFIIHSLVAYTRVGGHRVEVWRFSSVMK